ncbi:MAG: peptidylprolyl isomerase [Clostridiales bacterium]|nr:peptidylprolyl isomerase [Clostridiales bacterium]MDU6973059.1 peptidylprolyl isomerase [Clostridiales bacterium]
MKQKKNLLVMMMLCMSILLAGCASPSSKGAANVEVQALQEHPIVTMNIKDYGTVTIELYPEKAPNTVNNFVTLANGGFYDGLTFHRTIEGFMIQGGDPEGIGTGGPGYSIPGEFASNGYTENDLKHTKGVISMARSQSPDSAGSQFFIMSADSPHLDDKYAAFGEVTSGIEIIEAIEKVATNSMDKPLEDVVIESVTVDTNGETVPEVVKMGH